MFFLRQTHYTSQNMLWISFDASPSPVTGVVQKICRQPKHLFKTFLLLLFFHNTQKVKWLSTNWTEEKDREKEKKKEKKEKKKKAEKKYLWWKMSNRTRAQHSVFNIHLTHHKQNCTGTTINECNQSELEKATTARPTVHTPQQWIKTVYSSRWRE